MVARDWEGERIVELYFNRHRVSAGEDEKVLEMDGDDDRTTM